MSNDESWTDVNLNEDGERGPATITGRTRDHEGNIHEGMLLESVKIMLIFLTSI